MVTLAKQILFAPSRLHLKTVQVSTGLPQSTTITSLWEERYASHMTQNTRKKPSKVILDMPF
jgi:hypothetical protein